MRILKKAGVAAALSLTLAMVSPVVLPVTGTIHIEAATVKLNKTKADISTGGSVTLKLTGTTEKDTVKWVSSDSSVATVSKTGKVTGKAAGTAAITATVNKKNYDCTVTVKKSSAKASNIKKLGGISFTMPKGWSSTEQKMDNSVILLLLPNDKSVASSQNLNIMVQKTGTKAPDMDIMKELYPAAIKASFESEIEIENFKSSTYKAKSGDVIVMQYSFNMGGTDIYQKQYHLFLDQYVAVVTQTSSVSQNTKTLDKQAKDIIDSIKVSK